MRKDEPARAADAYAARCAWRRFGPALGWACRGRHGRAPGRLAGPSATSGRRRSVNPPAQRRQSRAGGAATWALARREAWRPAIRATRAALALGESPQLRAEYETLVAEHGFRISGHEVDSDAASPRICIRFSEPLPRNRPDLADFVRVADTPGAAVETEAQQICVDGVVHGGRYRIQVRAGLPSAEGETLARTADLDIFVRDRAPTARFQGRAYVLPKGDDASIPVVSVNTDALEARVYRIGDRALTQAQADGTLFSQLDNWRTEQIKASNGEQVWQGVVEVKPELNRRSPPRAGWRLVKTSFWHLCDRQPP
jgi:uncharacterized protein YfaS (alpha-2-macroglobulin family)